MDNTKYYPLALEALVELAPEIAAARVDAQPKPARPFLGDVLLGLGDLPDWALFLGIANDGLPVLLNLHDATPGPLLLISDQFAGKTGLLRSMALSTAGMYAPEEIQFSVATSTTQDWDQVEQLPHCAGVISLQERVANELIASLYDWAHQPGLPQQVVLFFVDGLDKIANWDENTKSRLRWLLMRGPTRRIWPVLTLNSNLIGDVTEWLPLFRTFIYGRVENRGLGDMLTGASRANLDSLDPGTEFTMKEGDRWLRFWVPTT